MGPRRRLFLLATAQPLMLLCRHLPLALLLLDLGGATAEVAEAPAVEEAPSACPLPRAADNDASPPRHFVVDATAEFVADANQGLGLLQTGGARAPMHGRSSAWSGRASKLGQRSAQRSEAYEEVEDEEGGEKGKGESLMATTVKSMSMEERLSKGKLYFLFILEDSLPHEGIWKAFFAGAPKGSYQAFAHCTNQTMCNNLPIFAELEIEVVPTIASKWCVDLVSPEWKLAQAVLRSEVGEPEGPRKLVFISASALPIQPFSRVRQVLLKSDNSDICITPPDQWLSVSIFGTMYSIVKHHQWAVLNLEDAKAFVDGWEQLSSYRNYVGNGVLNLSRGDYKWAVPRMGSNGRANFSEVIPRSMIPDFPVGHQRCPDEEVKTSFIYGMHEPGKDAIWKAILSQSLCRTYVHWAGGKHPQEFSDFSDRLRSVSQDTSDSAPLFARKFTKDAQLDGLKAYIDGHR